MRCIWCDFTKPDANAMLPIASKIYTHAHSIVVGKKLISNQGKSTNNQRKLLLAYKKSQEKVFLMFMCCSHACTPIQVLRYSNRTLNQYNYDTWSQQKYQTFFLYKPNACPQYKAKHALDDNISSVFHHDWLHPDILQILM